MKKLGYIIVCAALLMTACQKESKRQYWSEEIMANGEEANVELVRFDNALLNMDTANMAESLQSLYEQYPVFMPMWVDYMYIGYVYTSESLEHSLPQFMQDTTFGFKYILEKEQEVFADISDLQQSLNQAFTRIKYLYPEFDIPKVYLTILGEFYADDSIIAISADNYLGSDFPYYDRFVYEYQKQTMRKECIPVDIVIDYLSRNIPYSGTQIRLLDQMLYRGKIMYLTAQIFDKLPGYEVMGWNKEQWNWSEQNEKDIWRYMMDQRDLFKTEHLTITNYLNDAPFTSEVSPDSPGRLGIWMGWRIVESYMEHNKEVTLQELMAESDAQKILELSYYKP